MTIRGLISDDNFYFGNLPGGTNNDADPAFKFIDALDEFNVRQQSGITSSDLFVNSDLPTAIQNTWDVNRDDNVDALDQFVDRFYAKFPFGELEMIDIATGGPFAPTARSASANSRGRGICFGRIVEQF